ncbi:MAG: AAA family ATPase [Lachnospiraceae bacterium]|nr:AAA family ATPase [Lachnospiraceae bacterium]
MLGCKIEFDQNFVLSRRDGTVLPVELVKSALADMFGQSLAVEHEDFALFAFSLDTDAAEQTAQQINTYLQKEFSLGDGRQIHESNSTVFYVYPELMLSVSKSGRETNESPLHYFDRLIGWDEFKALCEEISVVAPQILANNTQISFQHQNYLISANDGAGLSTILSTFADFITALGLFPFCKENPVIELRLGAKSEDGFTSPYDAIMMLGKIENRNHLVCFDISAFTERAKHNDLKSFLRQLLPLESDYIFAFRLPYIEPNALRSIHDIIADILYLRTVSIPPYTNEQLRKGAAIALSDYSFELAEDAWDVFFARIAEEKSDGRFYGMQSVRKIVCEILWLKHLADAKCTAASEETSSGEATAAEAAPATRVIAKADILSLSATYNEHTRSGFDELSEMIGMEAIAERIREIVSQVHYALRDKSVDRPTLHMRFTGAPGTGKTTVARILGRIFAEEGILRNGYFFEFMSRDLCGEYVGQTAPKTAAICRDAYGSVLFLDEAYALYTGENGNDYGREALATLISEMENHRDDMVIIMAGYKDDMDKLMAGNAGLRSRMPYQIDFPGYTKEQLTQIFMLMVRKHFDYAPELEATAKEFFDSLDPDYMASTDFANARFVRNLYERTWSKAAIRSQLDGEGHIRILPEDFRTASSEAEFSERLQTHHTVGFL